MTVIVFKSYIMNFNLSNAYFWLILTVHVGGGRLIPVKYDIPYVDDSFDYLYDANAYALLDENEKLV